MAKPDKIEKNLAHAQGDTPEELVKLREWWNAHGNQVTIALLVVLAVVLGVRWYNSHQESVRAAAAASLASATTRADQAAVGLAYGRPDAAALDDAEAALEGVVAERNASSAPLALLRLAAVRYARGRADLAEADYRTFLQDYPDHEFASLARVGVAHCVEAAGRIDEAVGLYRDAHAALEGSHLAPDALLGQARCLILQGTDESRADARELLGGFLIDSSGDTSPSPWAGFAQELLNDANRLSMPAAGPSPADLETLLTPPAVDVELPDLDAGQPEAAEAPGETGETGGAPATETPAEPETPPDSEPAA